MNDKAARDMLDHKKTLETLIALDTAFGCLLDNIRATQPALAQSLAIDLKQATAQSKLHLPPEIHGAADLLEKWHARLTSEPSPSNSHLSS